MTLCFSIILEASQRLLDSPKVKNPMLVLVVGCLGLASNLFGFLVLGGHSHSHGHEETGKSQNDNIRGLEGGDTYHQGQTNEDHTKCKTTLQHHESSTSQERSTQPRLITRQSVRRKQYSPRSNRFSQDDFAIHPANYRQNIISAVIPHSSDYYDEESEGMDGEENYSSRETQSTESDPLIQKKSHHKHNQTHFPLKGDKHDSCHDGHRHNKLKKAKKGGHFHADLGMNAIMLHVLGDAIGNIGVIISALVIWLTDWSGRYYADPIVSLLITFIILWTTIPLTIASAKILLQATPDHIEIDDIKKDIQALSGVASCHHVHIWQLNDTQLVASMHIHFEFPIVDCSGEKYMDTARAVRECLHAYGIHSATVQPEFCGYQENAQSPPVQVTSSLRGPNRQTKCGLDADECLLKCVDDCEGKPCCSPKTTVLQCNDS